MTEYPTNIAELVRLYGKNAGEIALSALCMAQKEDGAPLRCRRRGCRRALRCFALLDRANRPVCHAGITPKAEAGGHRVTCLILDLWNGGLLSLEEEP